MYTQNILQFALLALAFSAYTNAIPRAEENGYDVGPPPKKCPVAPAKEEVKDGKQYICIKDVLVETCPADKGLEGPYKAKLTDKDEAKRENPDGKKDKAGFVWVCTKDKPEINDCSKEEKWSWVKRCCTSGKNKGKKEGLMDEKTKGYWHCTRDKPLKLGKEMPEKGKEAPEKSKKMPEKGKPKKGKGKGKMCKKWTWVLYCKDPCKRKCGDPVDPKNPKKGKWKCCLKTYIWTPVCGGKSHPQWKEYKDKFPITPEDKDLWECIKDKWVKKCKCPPAGKKEGVEGGKLHTCIKDKFICTCPIETGLTGEWKDKLSDKDQKKRENPDGKKDKAGFVWVCTKDKPEVNDCHKEKKWSWEKRCCTSGNNKGKKEGLMDEKTKGYWHCNRDKPLKLDKGKESKPWTWILYCKDSCKRKCGSPVDPKNLKKGKWKCCLKTYVWTPVCGGKNHPQAKEFKDKFPIAPEAKDLWECIKDKWVQKKKEEEGYAV